MGSKGRVVAFKDDVSQWKRLYENMSEGIDHNVAEYILSVTDDLINKASRTPITGITGQIRAPAAAGNVGGTKDIAQPEPAAYDNVNNSKAVKIAMQLRDNETSRQNKLNLTHNPNPHNTGSTRRQRVPL